jgi:membrane-bound lytic murein transglycosylase D
MEVVALKRFREQFTRARARVAFPVLGAAMAIGTLVTGLERTSYLGGFAGVEQVSSDALGSPVTTLTEDLAAITGVKRTPVSSAASFATLDTDLEHARIDRWVTKLTTSARGDFRNSLQRMAKYEDMIMKKIDARGMPRELIYLALIESNFNPTAQSPVKAVGLWQFMSPTAREYGLSVGRKVDERKNPALATDAALTYLTKLHTRFGSWYLAAAAYNSGQGTVSKAMRTVTGRTKGTDADFFRILPKLPKETQDYVPKLIATAKVGMEREKYGM